MKCTTSRRMFLATHYTVKASKFHVFFFSSHFDDCFHCPFFLENLCHSQVGNGYEIFGHFSTTDDVINSLQGLVEEAAVGKVTVVLGAQKVKHYKASEFKKECSEYFERYYKILAMKAPLVLPSDIPSEFKGIVNTMSRWCQSTGTGRYVKGFVLHSFLIKDIYLKMYNGKLDDLSRKLNIEYFPSTPTIIVYNPNEMIFLLVRLAESEDIENELKLCGVELKMLMLIVGDELKNTGIKIIPLVVTDKISKCRDCRSYLISREEIENDDLFTSWCEQNSVNFDITSAEHFEENKAKEIFARIVSCMGATKIHDIFPAFTAEDGKQMKGALLLLTLEQIDILYSEDKHIIIDGPYGSGKSIIGRPKARMIAKNLPEKELLYYISYDSRSALLDEIQGSNPKIKIYPDKEEQKGTKLSDMIREILRRNDMESQRNETSNKSQKKINLIIDEYDGEKLDRSEANALNNIINAEYKKIFQDTVIFLISQSTKKKRQTNDNSTDGNRFDLLEKMKRKTLTLVMRNSIQINNLLEVTKEFLENVATRYELQQKPKIHLEQKNYGHQTKQGNNTNKNEEITVTQQSPESVVGRFKDSEIKLKSSVAQFRASYLELDEAFDYAGIPTASGEDGNKIENRFIYEKAIHIGHGAESKLPVLFELYQYENNFQKVLSLTAVFENIQIARSSANSKHVLLHFNDDNNMPKLAFKLLDLKLSTKVNTKVTNSYEEFKNDSLRKYIFAGNFRTFRGLEHSRITIIIDRDIYSLQHYLVECIARCTTHLNVVVLGANKTINSITQKWKEGISGKPLVEIRKIKLNKENKQSKDADFQENERITIDTFSQEYKKLQQTFNQPSFQSIEGENLTSQQEAKLAIEM